MTMQSTDQGAGDGAGAPTDDLHPTAVIPTYEIEPAPVVGPDGTIAAQPGATQPTEAEPGPTGTKPAEPGPTGTKPAGDGVQPSEDEQRLEAQRLQQQQESRQIQQQREQLEIQQWQQRLEQEVAAKKQEYLNHNWPENMAQHMADIYRASQEELVASTMQARAAVQETQAKTQVAATLAAESGMSVEDLMQYPDARSMQLAARQHKGFQGQIDALREEFGTVRQQAAAQNAPPGQSFEGGAPASNPSIDEMDALIASGQIDSIPQSYVRQMMAEGSLTI